MKIINHKYHEGLYNLATDKNELIGAGISFIIDSVRIVFYTGTSDIPDREASDMICAWVNEQGGKGLGGGMSTRTQSWREWKIPMSFDQYQPWIDKWLDKDYRHPTKDCWYFDKRENRYFTWFSDIFGKECNPQDPLGNPIKVEDLTQSTNPNVRLVGVMKNGSTMVVYDKKY